MSWFGDIKVWIVMSGYEVWWFDNLIKIWHVPWRGYRPKDNNTAITTSVIKANLIFLCLGHSSGTITFFIFTPLQKYLRVLQNLHLQFPNLQ